jgi:uncharacterized protein (TIGR03067 family)
VNFVFFGLALTVAAPAPKDAPKPAPSDNPLLGEWVVESHVHSGKPIPRTGKPDRVKITKYHWVVNETETEANLSLDSTKDPPHIDFWIPKQGEETRVRSIYKLEGDTLTVCYSIGPDRPSMFESPAKSRIWLMTLKRVKPEK